MRSLDWILLLIGAGAMVIGVKARRTQLARRRGRARTIDLSVDDVQVERSLADGRQESARWAQLKSVEVVCTPIPTADGARSFLLLAEHAAAGDESGCLVPLGVGYESAVLARLTGLNGFRIEVFNEAAGHKPPRRTIIWEREPS